MADSPAPLPADLVAMVREISTGHGEARPDSVAYVETTRGAAVRLVLGYQPSPGTQGDEQLVWLIQVRGHFVARRGPLRARRATGTVLYLVIDQGTRSTTSVALGDRAIDLRTLGSPGLA